MKPVSELGQVLRDFRASRNLSATDMANDLGIGKASLSLIERGHRPPTDKFIESLLETYDFSESERKSIEEISLLSKNCFTFKWKDMGYEDRRLVVDVCDEIRRSDDVKKEQLREVVNG